MKIKNIYYVYVSREALSRMGGNNKSKNVDWAFLKVSHMTSATVIQLRVESVSCSPKQISPRRHSILKSAANSVYRVMVLKYVSLPSTTQYV